MFTAFESRRWAPWWAYVLVIAPANLGKQELLPAGSSWWLAAFSTAALVVVGVAVVTAAYRAAVAVQAPDTR
jgi:hypothetical protein